MATLRPTGPKQTATCARAGCGRTYWTAVPDIDCGRFCSAVCRRINKRNTRVAAARTYWGTDGRNAELQARVKAGERCADLARETGLTRQRIHQIAHGIK